MAKTKGVWREFWHYVVGTMLIIFGGHWFSGVIGLEEWAINQGLLFSFNLGQLTIPLPNFGGIVLFLYYLIIYIIFDQLMHKVFKL